MVNNQIFYFLLAFFTVSGIGISYDAFASPIFEIDTVKTASNNYLPEQSISVNNDSVADMNVAVDGTGVHIVWIDGPAGFLPSLFYQIIPIAPILVILNSGVEPRGMPRRNLKECFSMPTFLIKRNFTSFQETGLYRARRRGG